MVVSKSRDPHLAPEALAACKIFLGKSLGQNKNFRICGTDVERRVIDHLESGVASYIETLLDKLILNPFVQIPTINFSIFKGFFARNSVLKTFKAASRSKTHVLKDVNQIFSILLVVLEVNGEDSSVSCMQCHGIGSLCCLQ
jgi:hypothetical protein